jgi:Domain of unknown function (DUF5911)
MPQRIEDYALIGDLETAALVGRDGSIDWLCVPRFDSDACFAALLGTSEHGRWMIAPVGAVRRVRRRYRAGTLILATEFETDEGTATLIDFMPPRRADPDLVRIVEGKRGSGPRRKTARSFGLHQHRTRFIPFRPGYFIRRGVLQLFRQSANGENRKRRSCPSTNMAARSATVSLSCWCAAMSGLLVRTAAGGSSRSC